MGATPESTTETATLTTNAESVTQVPTDATVESKPFKGPSIEELQGLTSISEAELRGEDLDPDNKDDKKADDSSTDAKGDKSEEDKKSEEKKADEKSDNKDDKKSDDKDEKKPVEVPPGYVKLEALREARKINSSLREENTRLKLQVAESKIPKQDTSLVKESEVERFKDFKALTKAELRDLAADDPEAAAEYAEELTSYQDFLRRQDQQKIQDEANERQLNEMAAELQSIYNEAEKQMEEAVPGIFTVPEVQEEFRDFATGIGFTEDMFYLTNPETRIILPGESEPLVLGEQAADIIKLLAGVKSKLAKAKDATPPDEAQLREKIKAELEPTLRQEIEAELLVKFKKGKKEKFQHLDEIPDSQHSSSMQGKVLSEAEFAKLSPADQDAYLKGSL